MPYQTGTGYLNLLCLPPDVFFAPALFLTQYRSFSPVRKYLSASDIRR